MAEKKVWIGSVGPFLYDDEDVLLDENEEVIDQQRALHTDGTISADGLPTAENEVIRKGDVGNGLVVDGDIVDLDYAPVNYVPDATGTPAEDERDLAAHLKGIDVKLGDLQGQIDAIVGWSGTFETGDGKTVTVSNGLITDVS